VPQPPPTTTHSPASPPDFTVAPPCAGRIVHRPSAAVALAGLLLILSPLAGGCATLRTTDPPRTATEQFLMSVAATRAIDQLSADALRDRQVFIDTTYLTGFDDQKDAAVPGPTDDYRFLVGELRARLLMAGVRLVQHREDSQVVLEVRSGSLGIDRYEYLLGIPALYVNNLAGSTGNVPVAIPELAIVKWTRQRGYASVAFVAYWNDTGELVAASGPFVGRTLREDYWFFGIGPKTVGNIPSVEQQ
jgi:hypothetical protein